MGREGYRGCGDPGIQGPHRHCRDVEGPRHPGAPTQGPKPRPHGPRDLGAPHPMTKPPPLQGPRHPGAPHSMTKLPLPPWTQVSGCPPCKDPAPLPPRTQRSGYPHPMTKNHPPRAQASRCPPLKNPSSPILQGPRDLGAPTQEPKPRPPQGPRHLGGPHPWDPDIWQPPPPRDPEARLTGVKGGLQGGGWGASPPAPQLHPIAPRRLQAPQLMGRRLRGQPQRLGGEQGAYWGPSCTIGIQQGVTGVLGGIGVP